MNETPQTKPEMKYSTLSSAIRAGAKLHPQGFGSYYRNGKTCALGAAQFAVAGVDDIFRLFPVLCVESGYCQECGEDAAFKLHLHVGTMIAHLNDYHTWSREQIADWVEEYENEHLGFETLSEEVKEVESPALSLSEEAAISG